MDEHKSDILIIGAGMAGLTCATALTANGCSVTILDKGRGPGGRMAARRAEIAGETISFDHGAQYFTARNRWFLDAVDVWEKLGVVARWPAAGVDAWVGVPGMNAPVRAMAEPLDVRWNARVTSLGRDGEHWQAATHEGSFLAERLLVAIPAEQAYELFKSNVPELAAIAGAVKSEPCWALMVAFDKSLDLQADVVRDESGPISWAARNSTKPERKGTECWVLHASPGRSRELIGREGDYVAGIMLDDFFRQQDIAPVQPIHIVPHRWLYAKPAKIAGEPARYDAEAGIGIAGDYLHSARVEGAFLSGHALAEKVLA
ncbi:MAG: FAD-dependent oxidoreductase [Pseudomonadota bacterium]